MRLTEVNTLLTTYGPAKHILHKKCGSAAQDANKYAQLDQYNKNSPPEPGKCKGKRNGDLEVVYE